MSATSEPTQPVRTRPSGIATHGKSLKRYFIGPFIMLNGAGMIYSIVRCAISATGNAHQTAAWAIAAGAHTTVLAFGPRSWPRRDSGLIGLIALTAAATVAEAALLPASLAALIEVVVAFLGSVVYVMWYARFGREPATALRPGTPMPDVPLVTLDGDEFAIARLRGAPAALFFVRGAWCPYCSAQVRAVVAAYGRLRDRGVRVAVISPRPNRRWASSPTGSGCSCYGCATRISPPPEGSGSSMPVASPPGRGGSAPTRCCRRSSCSTRGVT